MGLSRKDKQSLVPCALLCNLAADSPRSHETEGRAFQCAVELVLVLSCPRPVCPHRPFSVPSLWGGHREGRARPASNRVAGFTTPSEPSLILETCLAQALRLGYPFRWRQRGGILHGELCSKTGWSWQKPSSRASF